jgi:hypothetical protein
MPRERPALVSACRSPLSAIRETLSVFEEHRCKRFDASEPLASRLSVCAPPLSDFVERRCKRFDGESSRTTGRSECVEPLSVLKETLFLFAEYRCKRFDASEPLALPPSVCAQRLSAFRETPSVFAAHGSTTVGGGKRFARWPPACRERRSALEGTLMVFGQRRWKRFDVSEPLASRLSAFEERLSVFAETRRERFAAGEPLASGRSAGGERRSGKRGRTEKHRQAHAVFRAARARPRGGSRRPWDARASRGNDDRVGAGERRPGFDRGEGALTPPASYYCGMSKRARRSAPMIVPRSLFRAMTGMSVIPICGVAGVALLDPACINLASSVACEGFGLNGSCEESNLPAGLCNGSTLQLYTTPPTCTGNVYLVMPAAACGCLDGAAYVACTNSGPTAYEGCACGSPPAGFTAACPTSASGLSECLVDAGYSAHADCGVAPHANIRDAGADVREAGKAVADAGFGDATLD